MKSKLDTKAAATFTDCSYRYLQQLRWEKRGPKYYKVAGSREVYYELADLIEWKNRRQAVQAVETLDSAPADAASANEA